MAQVFTSYSRRDTETVDSIVEKMSQAGIDVWIDRSDIKAGDRWRVQIVKAIRTSPAFVLMLSPSSAASDNVRKEIDLSQGYERPIFPVMLQKVRPLPDELSYQLAGEQIIDVEKLGLDSAVEQLIETLNEHLRKIEQAEEPAAQQVELVIQGIDLNALTPEKQQQLLDFMASLTSADRSQMQIARIAAGSVHVFVDMPTAAAYELLTSALNSDPRFKELGITSLRLEGDKKFVNVSTGKLGLAATVGPLMALWLKVPALLAPVLGATVGKALTVSLAAIVFAAVALSVPTALGPILFPSPTPLPPSTQTVPPPPATGTPTATQAPTLTATETATVSPTPTATASQTPSLTPVPTFAILQGEVINRVPCYYGPGSVYLYRFGLFPSNQMEVRGRMDLWNGRQTITWLWGLPEGFPDVCWVNARDVKLDGDLDSLEVIYPDKVDLPFLRDPRWPIPQNVKVERLGDEVTISWDFFDVPLGERENDNAPRYVLEVWLCQDGQVRFTPIPVYANTRVSVIDQAGCAEPSHGRIVLSEKHGKWGPGKLTGRPIPCPLPNPFPRLMTTIDQLNARSQGFLPGLIGIEFLTAKPGRLTSRLVLRPELLAPNGYLHAATIIALADTTCGYGTFIDLPDGANNFTTIELKSNFLGTAREGNIACVATRVHSGRTTQVWDAEVTDEANGKKIALFRCTQLILYPRRE